MVGYIALGRKNFKWDLKYFVFTYKHLAVLYFIVAIVMMAVLYSVTGTLPFSAPMTVAQLD